MSYLQLKAIKILNFFNNFDLYLPRTKKSITKSYLKVLYSKSDYYTFIYTRIQVQYPSKEVTNTTSQTAIYINTHTHTQLIKKHRPPVSTTQNH